MDRVSVRLIKLCGQFKDRVSLGLGSGTPGPVYHPPHRLTTKRKALTYRASPIHEPGSSVVHDGHSLTHSLSLLPRGRRDGTGNNG